PARRTFQYRRTNYRTCDCCGKRFTPPTIFSGVMLIFCGILVAGVDCVAFKADRGAIFGFILGPYLIWTGIVSLIRCAKSREECVRGFDVLPHSPDPPEITSPPSR